MFDIDYFKKYNDTYGHLTGDFCLQTIAQAIKELFSEKSGYIFCRYGGEEFALIMPGASIDVGMNTALTIQKTVQSLKIPHISSEIADTVTLSIGLATLIPSASSNPQTLIKAADSALYESKTKGRNTISIESIATRKA